MSRPRRRRGTALAVFTLVLVGCTTTAAPPDPVTPPPETTAATPEPASTAAIEGGTLRYALGGNPASIDPRFVAEEVGLTVVDALFDSLVDLGEDGETAVPAAAEEWEVSENGRTYRFTLRENGRFHDGTPVVAGDFVRAFRRIMERDADPLSFNHYLLEPVVGYERVLSGEGTLTGVEAVNRRTLKIRLRYPSADFPGVLAHPALGPVPRTGSDGEAFAEAPVGNGPFAMAEPWQQNQFIRVVRFPGHHSPARLDEVLFQIFADDASRQQQYDDFENRRVDVAEVPAEDFLSARTTYGVAQDGVTGPGVIDGLTGAVSYYGFNVELPPFDDPAVRRAITLLVDRDRIVEEILLETRVPADALVPGSLPGAQSGLCDLCRYDPDAAREELGLGEEGDEGSADLGPIEIVHNTGTTNERIAERVAEDIATALGIEVETRRLSLRDLVAAVREGEVGMFWLGLQADHPSPGAILQPLFRSDRIGRDNLTRYDDEDVDRLLDQARAEPDRRRRLELYQQVESQVLADAPVAPIHFYRHAKVVAETVQDLRIGPLGLVSLETAWKLSDT